MSTSWDKDERLKLLIELGRYSINASHVNRPLVYTIVSYVDKAANYLHGVCSVNEYDVWEKDKAVRHLIAELDLKERTEWDVDRLEH